MKHLSFRILFLCIFLPPVLYVFSIRGFESVIGKRWSEELDRTIISDPGEMLKGRMAIQDEIRRNVNLFLDSRTLIKWGVVPQIVVRTKAGRWLYPRTAPPDPFGPESESFSPLISVEVGRNNLEIMEEGIVLLLDVQIPNNSWFANSILVLYIFIFSFVLYRAHRSRTEEADRMYQQELEAVTGKLKVAEERLWSLANGERERQVQVAQLQARLADAGNKVKTTEEAALAELESLEEKLLENAALREKAEREVGQLRGELERLEASKTKSSGKKEKKSKHDSKRLRTLYKNLELHERAVAGFLSLEKDLQLRAEELISLLNADSSQVSVRRKVFGKINTLPALESEFGYKGRIYWRQREDGKVEILAIGTKNTQGKDLAYLESL